MNPYPYTLISFHDLRPVDFDSGKRIALPVDQMAHCNRCDRRHVRVFTVQDNATGEQFKVGETCAKRLIYDGCGFEAADLRRAKREAKEAAELARNAHWTERAYTAISGALSAITMPEPEWTTMGDLVERGIAKYAWTLRDPANPAVLIGDCFDALDRYERKADRLNTVIMRYWHARAREARKAAGLDYMNVPSDARAAVDAGETRASREARGLA